MFQLIIGISLGIILLFVLLLLVSELTATYPVWKHFQKTPFTTGKAAKLNKGRSPLKRLLLLLFSLVALCLVAFFMRHHLLPAKKHAIENKAPEVLAAAAAKNLRLRSAAALFTLETKWEEGKIYGKGRITFRDTLMPVFVILSYLLLDKDGFLIKEFQFPRTDFLYETDSSGRTTALLNRFRAAMDLKEYRHIASMQVVLDKKLLTAISGGESKR